MPAIAPPPADPDRFDEAVRYHRRRVPMLDTEWLALEKVERRHAFTVAAVTQARLVQEVWEAIDRAVEEGTTLDDFRVEVGDKLTEAWGEDDPMRVETIFRTNVMQAYNEGREEIFSDPEVAAARPFRRVDVADDSRICETCEPFAEVVLPADDPWWATHLFPVHPNCRCVTVALTPDEAEVEGIKGPPGHAPAPAEGFGTHGEMQADPSSFASPIGSALRDKLG